MQPRHDNSSTNHPAQCASGHGRGLPSKGNRPVIFDASEFKSRFGVLLRHMNETNLDGMLLDDSEALHYFTGFDISLTNYRALIVKRDGTATFVLRKLDVAPLVERAWVKNVVGYPDWESGSEAVAKAVRDEGLGHGRIGISLQSHALTVDRFNTLKALLPEADFVDIGDLPFVWRKQKSAAEIAKLAKASEVADLAIQLIAESAAIGMTERDAARMAAEAYLRFGADGGFLGVITAGKDWDFLHGHLHDTPLVDGDILHIELVPRVDGYSARLMRCVVMGEITDQQHKVAKTLVALQDAQIAALKPGAIARDVDAIVRDGLLQSGLRTSYDNVTGYTTGWYSDYSIRGSDFTWIFHPKADWMVEEGMVFHMYASAQGIAFSETVVVRPQGGERLSRIERKLFGTAERETGQ
jgi:Xaa-Pro aminopeptidase